MTKEKENSNTPVKEQPSRRLRKTWAKKLMRGEARIVPVYVNGSWSFKLPRGERRVMDLGDGGLNIGKQGGTDNGQAYAQRFHDWDGKKCGSRRIHDSR